MTDKYKKNEASQIVKQAWMHNSLKIKELFEDALLNLPELDPEESMRLIKKLSAFITGCITPISKHGLQATTFGAFALLHAADIYVNSLFSSISDDSQMSEDTKLKILEHVGTGLIIELRQTILSTPELFGLLAQHIVATTSDPKTATDILTKCAADLDIDVNIFTTDIPEEG